MVSGNKIYEFLVELTKGHDTRIALHDVDYSLPDEAYIENFGTRFRNFTFGLGLEFKDEAWDCDNFALLACALAKMDHGLHTNKASELAVGMAGIATETILHKVVAVIHEQDGKLVLKLYEPQKQGNVCMREFHLPVQRYLSLFF